jgi:hypothetical protein
MIPGREDGLRRRAVLVLFILAALVYLRALPGEFVWDDRTFFLDNDILVNLKPWDLKEIFLYPSNMWKEHLPVRDFLCVVQYNLFGETTYGYHAVSLILYLSLGYAAYIFICRLYKDLARVEEDMFFGLSKRSLSVVVVTALFLFHPVHVEVVAYISSQKDLLYSLFSLLSIMLLYRAYRDESIPAWRSLVPSLLFYYLAFLSKNMAVSTGVLIPLLWLLVLKRKGRGILQAVVFWIVINIPVYLWIYYCIALSRSYEKMNVIGLSFVERVHGSARILGAHTILAAKPFPLNFGYPFVEEWSFDINFCAGATVLALLSIMLIRNPRSLVTIGLLIYVIYMLPVLQFVMKVSNAAVFDRYLFMPVLGLGIVFERGLSYALGKRGRARLASIVLSAMVVLMMGVLTFSNIPRFRSDLSSLSHAYRTFPGWNRAAFDYVYALVEAGRLDDASSITDRENTFSDPPWVRDYFRGWILLERGDNESAIRYLRRASFSCRIGGYFPFADVQLGRALMRSGDLDGAERVLENVVGSRIFQPVERYKAKKLLERIRNNQPDTFI